MSPAVSVLIAVHNGLPYLEATLRSVMAQSLREIEIIVVDDASSDGTPEVLARLAAEEPRLRAERLEVNAGPEGAANHGLAFCTAPLIARIDADDIAHPTRLAVQKAHMDAHPDLLLLASSVRILDAEGRHTRTEWRALNPVRALWLTRFQMPVIHPSIMLRARFPDDSVPLYPDDRYAHDYGLVANVARLGPIAALDEPLTDYRVHGTSQSLTRRRQQNAAGRAVAETMQHPDIAGRTSAVLDAFYAPEQPLDPGATFRGLRLSIATEPGATAADRTWMREQAAKLAVHFMRMRRFRTHQIWLAFLRFGPDFILPFLRQRRARQQKERQS